MAKRLNGNSVMGLVGTSSSAYIQGISDGTTQHDIAVKNGITFFNGKSDTDGIVWDGVQELEVIIPTLADIVANPVTLVGVIDSPSDIPGNPQNGNLVYIGTSGTYFNEVCEAGDMAVYYDSAWHVISGENQITINASAGTTTGDDTLFTVSGTAKTILTVEGKTLSIALDYADVADKIKVVKGGTSPINITNGTVTVAGMSVGLTYVAGTSQDIATTMSINLPTSLASNAVTINENVLTDSDFTFTQGSFPTISKNAAAISINASTDISVEGSFVTSVTAVGGVSIVPGSQSGNPDLTYVAGLATASGKNFVTGLHEFVEGTDASTDVAFEIPGTVTVTGASTFATGFGAEGASGDVISSVSVGAVTIDSEGSGIVTGLSGAGSAVITGVTFGSASKDTTAQWFYDGLTDGTDVVTDVTVGTVSLVADNNGGSPAIVSASVNASHVLVFNTSNFMTPVTISQASSTISKKGFTKAGVTLTGFSSASDTLTFGGISQATTTISYKSLTTDSINVGLGSATKYVLDKDEEHAYSATMGYADISVTDATVSTGSPSLVNTGVTVTIPADTVAVGLNAGTLPSLSISSASGTLTGTVGTSLSTTEVSWLAINPEKRNIAGAGTYALTSNSAAEGIVGTPITVAAADTYDLNGAKVTIASGTFITAVEVSGVEVSTKSNA